MQLSLLDNFIEVLAFDQLKDEAVVIFILKVINHVSDSRSVLLIVLSAL